MTNATTCSCGAAVPAGDSLCPVCGAPARSADHPSGQPGASAGLWRTPERSAAARPPAPTADVPRNATVQLDRIREDVSPKLSSSAPPPPHAEVATPSSSPRAAAWSATAALPAVRRRWNRWLRAVPLVVLLLLFALAVGAGSAFQSPRTGAALPSQPIPAGLGETVTLPAGEFTLGLTEDNKEVVLALCYQLSDNYTTECRRQYLTDLGEYPSRTQAFEPLTVDRFEVTNEAWANCVDSGRCPRRDIDSCRFYSVARGLELRESVPESMLAPDHPAVCVTFEEAAGFCEARGMRVPTADEWERAGRSGDDRLQPWGRFVMPGLLNWGERVLRDFPIPGRVDGHELTAPVDEYRSGATDDGVHNMLGNVAEWVAAPSDDDAQAVAVRGGSYVDGARNLRLTWQEPMTRQERRSTIGFRCVR